MFNAYSIILGLFVIGGIAVTYWGWTIIAKARKTAHWPHVQGEITKSSAASSEDDAFPEILYSYEVKGMQYQGEVEFPSGTSPSQQLTNYCLNQYPLHSQVAVYYDPQHPESSTLQAGLGKGDWMIFALGLITTVLGILWLLA